jgi:hypothetical protein
MARGRKHDIAMDRTTSDYEGCVVGRGQGSDTRGERASLLVTPTLISCPAFPFVPVPADSLQCFGRMPAGSLAG